MSRPAGVLEVDHVLNVCQRRCDDLGVTVRYANVETASTDGHNITLPYVNHPITQQTLDRLYGFVIHECGHHLRPEAFAILEAAQPPKHLQAIYNIIEDDGMERERAMAWLGDRKALGIMNEGLVREVGDSWTQEDVILEPEPIATMLLGQLSRLEWDDYSQGATSALLRSLPSNVLELFNELKDEGWISKLRATQTALHTWHVACDLAIRLYPDNPESEYNEIRTAGEAGAKGEGSVRDISGDTMQQGKVDEEGEPSEDETDDTRVISWRDVVLSEHEVNKDAPPGGVAINWKGYGDTSKAFVMPTNQINIVDLSLTISEIEDKVGYYYGKGASLEEVYAH